MSHKRTFALLCLLVLCPFCRIKSLMVLAKSSIGEHSPTLDGWSSSSIVRISGSQIKIVAFSAFIAVPIAFL